MLSERDIEAAHPDAFDFVWGNLPPAKRAEFNRHLSGCRYCQAVVDEYSEIGQIIKQPSASRRSASRARRPDGRRNGHCSGRPACRARSPGRRRRPSRHPGLPGFPRPSLRLSPRPRSSRFRSSGLRPTPTWSSPHPQSTNRLRPSRRPDRWSLACRCGDVTLAAWPLSWPSQLPSSLPPSSFHSASDEARSRPSHGGDPAPCHHGGQGEWLTEQPPGMRQPARIPRGAGISP